MAAPVLTEDYVEALTRRVDALEKKLLSQDGALPVIPLTTAVRELGRKLDTLAGREKGEESLKMTEGAKVELLCGEVEQLRKFTDRMEEVHQLKDYINSTECQGLETHEKKLATVSATHLEQEARVAELTQQTHTLMDGYRRVMLQLSAQCVQWDEALGERETAKT
ncbi:Dynactin subunit 3 [Geodia barretti]|uniref:Dynactin subunit 3 n=1 Tax=Geodia barretti TaxID=519541 RepID=A0AA35XHI7_GEOBA|nr:Dynactin subunit 3 [Geodia barretti]